MGVLHAAPRSVTRTAPEARRTNDSAPRHAQMRSRTRRFATLFVYAWTIYTVIQGGALLTNEPYVHTLQTAPRAVQGATGDGHAQTLIKVQRTLPYEEKVLVIWRHPESGELGFWYGYFWGTYWLYPRRVDFVTDAKAIPPGFGIL